MTRIAALTCIVLLSSAFTLLLGCSDDDKNVVKPVVPTEGELTDVRFLFAEDVSEPDIMRTTELSLHASTYFLLAMPSAVSARDAIMPELSLPGDMTRLAINSINTPAMSAEGWYVFEYDITAIYDYTDSVYAVGLDSVRLLAAGSPVAWIGYATPYDVRESRDRAVWSNSKAGSGIKRQSIDLTIIDMAESVIGFELSVADTVHTSRQDDSGFCYVHLYQTGTGTGILVTGLQMGPTVCADSGKVAISTVVDLDCTGHSQLSRWGVEGLWTYEGVYNSSHVLSGKLTHGDKFWNFTDTCTPQNPGARR